MACSGRYYFRAFGARRLLVELIQAHSRRLSTALAFQAGAGGQALPDKLLSQEGGVG